MGPAGRTNKTQSKIESIPASSSSCFIRAIRGLFVVRLRALGVLRGEVVVGLRHQQHAPKLT
jgi:hypothetical protein